MNARRVPGSPRVRYRVGDVFLIALPGGGFAYGRILLILERIRRAGLFTATWNALGGPVFGRSLLVQVYQRLYRTPHIDSRLPITDHPYPSEFVSHTALYRGTLPIVSNQPVLASDIDFPEWVSQIRNGAPTAGASHPWDYYFQKGVLTVNLGSRLEIGDLVERNDIPRPALSLGIHTEILYQSLAQGAMYPNVHSQDLRQRLQYRQLVLSLAGFNTAMSYDEMCIAAQEPRSTAANLLAACTT